jgi:hypothetical protein
MCLCRKPPFEQAGYTRRALFLILTLAVQVYKRQHHTRRSTNWPQFGPIRGPIHRPRVFWRSALTSSDLQIAWETGANRPGSGTELVLVMIHQTMTTTGGIVRWRDGQPDMAQSGRRSLCRCRQKPCWRFSVGQPRRSLGCHVGYMVFTTGWITVLGWPSYRAIARQSRHVLRCSISSWGVSRVPSPFLAVPHECTTTHSMSTGALDPSQA